jgi:hypothetical protein
MIRAGKVRSGTSAACWGKRRPTLILGMRSAPQHPLDSQDSALLSPHQAVG